MKPSNAWTIARKDFRSYFTSPIAYIVIAAFLGIMGWMFFNILIFYAESAKRMAMMNNPIPSLAEGVIRPLYGNMNVVLLFLTPFITMRLLAEERKLHTLELLMTAPVTLWEIVIGKFLSAFLFISVMLGITAVYPIVLYATGNPDMASIVGCFGGMLLLGACYLSIGILCSALTENQIIAGILTYTVTLFFWLISWGAQSSTTFWAEILNYMSLISHYAKFQTGVIDTSDITFYLSFIGIGLFLTHRVLDSYRWR